MNSLTPPISTRWLLHSTSPNRPQLAFPPPKPRRCTASSVLKAPRPVGDIAEDDVLQVFIKERELTGDFISRLSDRLWLGEFSSSLDNAKIDSTLDLSQSSTDVSGVEDEGGFLKLKRTNEWLLGETSAPINKKMANKEVTNDSERRKRLNLLKYEALKRELLMLTVGIGSACSGYCLVALSLQAAVSYAVGVSFSCLYFQLLCQYSDNLSKEAVPQIFMQKKQKKIGIRSQDLEDLFERTVRGCGIALSSPRLVIPAAVYGLWELSQHFTHDLFDFQLVPAMVGIFAYKAAALVQVYRDNEDLQFIFPESDDGTTD